MSTNNIHLKYIEESWDNADSKRMVRALEQVAALIESGRRVEAMQLLSNHTDALIFTVNENLRTYPGDNRIPLITLLLEATLL